MLDERTFAQLVERRVAEPKDALQSNAGPLDHCMSLEDGLRA